MLIIVEARLGLYRNSLYCSCKFSVNLKSFQNQKFKKYSNQTKKNIEKVKTMLILTLRNNKGNTLVNIISNSSL